MKLIKIILFVNVLALFVPVIYSIAIERSIRTHRLQSSRGAFPFTPDVSGINGQYNRLVEILDGPFTLELENEYGPLREALEKTYRKTIKGTALTAPQKLAWEANFEKIQDELFEKEKLFKAKGDPVHHAERPAAEDAAQYTDEETAHAVGTLTPTAESISTTIGDSIRIGMANSEEPIVTKISDEKALKKAVEKAIVASIPPEFCWRGNLPRCPDVYPDRSGLRCYKNCEAENQRRISIAAEDKKAEMRKHHFHLFGGVCWENCTAYQSKTGAGTYKSFGPFCKKTDKKVFHLKKSFVSGSVPDFHSTTTCPGENNKKVLGLCYRKCSEFGYVSCGVGACAVNGPACAKNIVSIVSKTLLGVTELVLFALSLGGSGAVKEAIDLLKPISESELAKKVVEKALFDIADLFLPKLIDQYTNLARIFQKPELKQNIILDCKSKARILLKNFQNVLPAQIDHECEEEVEKQAREAEKKQVIFGDVRREWGEAHSVTDKVKAFAKNAAKAADLTLLFGIGHAIASCKELHDVGQVASANLKAECAKKSMEFAAAIDPTGVVGLITAFVYPTCRNSITDQKVALLE